MKKIAYLLGAGATQAEINFLGIGVDITVAGINRNIIAISKRRNGSYSKLLDRLGMPGDLDVEQIMSLFEVYEKHKTSFYYKVYMELRKLYRNYLVSQICINKRITPRLLSTLLYLDKNFGRYMGERGEEILGIMTTNYDSLAEESFKAVYNGVNYGFVFDATDYKMIRSPFPLLKLHGSFNWKVSRGNLKVSKIFERRATENSNCCWMPPSVYKKPSEYKKKSKYGMIFSKIWARAEQILTECDILRVVGSSLRNEDWSLISLIFNSRIKSRSGFEIELVIPDDDATGEQSNNRFALMQRLKFLGGLKNLYVLPVYERGDFVGDNVFRYWLDKKILEAEAKNNRIVSDEFISRNFKGG